MPIRSSRLVRAALALAACCASLQAGAATVTVTSTADNTTVDGQCTLREAILATNAGAASADCPATGTWGTSDTIAFNIPGVGVKLIQPQSAYAALTRPVTIDGYTQPGASVNTIAAGAYPNATGVNMQIAVEIDGAGAGNVHGLMFNTGSSNSVVRGLSIANFQGAGIYIPSTASVGVTGNLIGWHADGTTRGPNLYGVLTYGYGTVIGGGSPVARNLIVSGGESAVKAINTYNMIVEGNLIGVNRNGLSPGAALVGNGISLNDLTGPGISNNVIAHHSGDAIAMQGVLNGAAAGNTIGEGVGGAPLGNGGRGILLVNSAAVQTNGAIIHDNGIAGSGVGGIYVLGDAAYGNPVGNRLDNNAIYGSGGLGINLRPVGEAGGATVTPNDALDADTGPNGLQNFPVITSAQANANGSVTIAFTLDSKANGTYYVSAYANPACNASGHGEGRYYGGNAPVGTNGAGHATGTITVPAPLPPGWGAGAFVALLAHDSVDGTSEFSACAQVAAAQGGAGTPPVMNAVPDHNGAVGTAFSLNLVPYATPTDGDAISDWAYTGALPPGLSFNGGQITGTPTQSGLFTVQVRAGDKDGWSNTVAVRIIIVAVDSGGPGNPGGPAGVTGIPTLAEWGRVLLAVVLAVAGLAALRARRI